MNTINQLVKDYQERFDSLIMQEVKGGLKRGRKKAPIVKIPNYLNEVILPIITELIQKMPDHLIEIPNPKTYGIGEGDIYPIAIGKRTIGGLTYLEYKESQLHFILVNGKTMSTDRLPVSLMVQLESIIKSTKKDKPRQNIIGRM